MHRLAAFLSRASAPPPAPRPLPRAQGVVTHVAATPDKFSAENIADVVRLSLLLLGFLLVLRVAWGSGGCAAEARLLRHAARRTSRAHALLHLQPQPAISTTTAPLTTPLRCLLPSSPLPPRQVYAFSRCGFCHPDLITVVETAAGTLLKEAAADRGYVSVAC